MSKEILKSKIKKIGSCWIWIYSVNSDGYGKIKYKKKLWFAHRLSYSLFIGNIPKGKCVCHSCDNPPCINPKHLFLGSHNDNMKDMVMKGRQRGAVGERNWNSKLTLKQVKEIRRKYSNRKTATAKIAKIYRVSQPMISYILTGKNWKS